MKRSKYQKQWCPSNELLAEFKNNILGKERKDGKTKTAFGKKRTCDVFVGKF